MARISTNIVLKIALCLLYIEANVKVEALIRNKNQTVEVSLLKQTSLAFVIDYTTSMTDDIAQVKIGTKKILAEFLSRKHNPIKNYVLSLFNDPEVKPVLVTEDPNLFDSKIQEIVLDGDDLNEDCPELSLEGIKRALISSLPGAFIYVFTDATAKDYYLKDDINALAIKKNVHITFVLTGKCTASDSDPQFQPYVDLAANTGGQLFELGVRTEVGKILEYVKDTLNTRTVYIISETIEPNKTKSLLVDVDSNMGILTVVVSGQSPEINVYNPNGDIETVTPRVDLSTMRAVRVENPMIGRWDIQVAAASSGSTVQVSTLSDISFDVGFNHKMVYRFEETFERPSRDKLNYLFVTPIPNVWQPTTANIIDIDGKISAVLPLTPVSGSIADLYRSPRFRTPTIQFKVVIYGYDQDNNIIQRITTILIKSESPVAPKILNDGNLSDYTVKKNDELSLHCFTSGTEPTIMWLKNGIEVTDFNIIELLNKNQSLVIKYIDVNHEATWTCVVKNTLGEDKKDFTVTVQIPVWGEWSSWSECSTTCGNGVQNRYRKCIMPAKLDAEKNEVDTEMCIGSNTEMKSCTVSGCNVDGNWGKWTDWSPCSKSCGIGEKSRYRLCDNPEPAGNGRFCEGDPYQEDICMNQLCVFDWSKWSDWSPCSLTCSGGVRTRNRTCLIPPTAKDVEGSCTGETTQIDSCNLEPCKAYQWTPWSSWSECSTTCDVGIRYRKRQCVIPGTIGVSDIVVDDDKCTGISNETDKCSSIPCSVSAKWENWSNWSPCSKTCGGGETTRRRFCNNPIGSEKSCEGPWLEKRHCKIADCVLIWGHWSSWKECSVTCGGGRQTRKRQCLEPKSGACEGFQVQSRICNRNPCPTRRLSVNGNWSSWSDWSACTVTCGNGYIYRTRNCNNPEPAHGGSGCVGRSNEVNYCYNSPCKRDGGWSEWSEWLPCSATCGPSHRERTRICNNPPPANGGKYCMGPFKETNRCDLGPCPSWSNWGDWSECSATCGPAQRTRNRTCLNQIRNLGMKSCEGSPLQIERCREIPCNSE